MKRRVSMYAGALLVPILVRQEVQKLKITLRMSIFTCKSVATAQHKEHAQAAIFIQGWIGHSMHAVITASRLQTTH